MIELFRPVGYGHVGGCGGGHGYDCWNTAGCSSDYGDWRGSGHGYGYWYGYGSRTGFGQGFGLGSGSPLGYGGHRDAGFGLGFDTVSVARPRRLR